MTTPLPLPLPLSRPSTGRHLNYHYSTSPTGLLFFAIALLCAAEQSLAYMDRGRNHAPKQGMRASRMACHAHTQKEMVENLASAGIVKSSINKQALLSVDRRNYVLDRDHQAYADRPQPLGYGATISAPHMHAHVLEDLLPSLLRASENEATPLSILDVGCGSGYLTSVFGRMVAPAGARRASPSSSSPVLNDGKVYGIDVIPQLVEMSKTNILKADGDLFDSDTVRVMERDGWKGYPKGSPYHAIHVGAAAATFPKILMKQLTVGGVMVIPVGPAGGLQYLYKVERIGGKGEVVGVSDNSKGFQKQDYRVERVLGVRYVPLVRTD